MKFPMLEAMMSTVRLTTYQKQVIAIIFSSPDQEAHDESFSFDRNLIGARDMLTKLNLIQNTEGDSYKITDQGMQFAEKEGVLENGALSAEGEALASKGSQEGSATGQPPTASADDTAAQGSTMPVNTAESKWFNVKLIK